MFTYILHTILIMFLIVSCSYLSILLQAMWVASLHKSFSQQPDRAWRKLSEIRKRKNDIVFIFARSQWVTHYTPTERNNKQTNNVIICYTNHRVTFSFERVRFWICRPVIGWRCLRGGASTQITHRLWLRRHVVWLTVCLWTVKRLEFVWKQTAGVK